MNKEMEIQMNEFEEFREKKDTGFSLKISNLREEMEKAKFLLAGLYAINDLEFFIGIYDDNTKKVKQQRTRRLS